MKRGIIILMLGIPAASLIMGAITLYIAFSTPSQEISVDHAPLSKTSWQSERENGTP